MGMYLVSYDLSEPNRDYTKLIAFIKSQTDWANVLESVWFVESPKTAFGLAEQLMGYIDSDDHLMVTPVSVGQTVRYNLDPRVETWMKGRHAA